MKNELTNIQQFFIQTDKEAPVFRQFGYAIVGLRSFLPRVLIIILLPPIVLEVRGVPLTSHNESI